MKCLLSQTVQPTPWNVHLFGIKERMKGKPGYTKAARMGDGSVCGSAVIVTGRSSRSIEGKLIL